jgi:hypothetical protein
MSLHVGYLTPKQSLIWRLRNDGLSEASIARKLTVTRQTVHHALDTANTKIGESLRETAEINKIEIETLDPAKGYLIGYSHHFRTKTFITFSAKNGVQIWYKHEGNCQKCRQLKTCRQTLIDEAKDRKLELQQNADEILPSELAEILFAAITGEGKDGNA